MDASPAVTGCFFHRIEPVAPDSEIKHAIQRAAVNVAAEVNYEKERG